MRRKRRKKKNLRIILTALLVAAFVAALGAVLIWKVFDGKRCFRKRK